MRVGEESNFLDEKASKAKRETIVIKDLFSSPFVVEIKYGANYEGYWCYEHMVLQLEDCMDCSTVLHLQLEFLFIFDHSCGHD